VQACIVCSAGLAAYRRLQVSSNVRRRKRNLVVPQMKTQTLLVALVLTCSPGLLLAQAPVYVGTRVSATADIQAIEKVTLDFRTALTTKDAKLLSSLLLNDKILFVSPQSPATTRRLRQESNVHADGVPPGGAQDFLKLVANTKVSIEERFYNIKILQDGHVAWVTFDYDFLVDGKVQNYGVEVWQMVKDADDRWKILSVVWSSNGTPP
jgi:ketosteroid isomerase-like protein